MIEKVSITILLLVMAFVTIQTCVYKPAPYPQKVIVFTDNGHLAKVYHNITDAEFKGGALHFTDNGCSVTVYTPYHLEIEH